MQEYVIRKFYFRHKVQLEKQYAIVDNICD